MVQEQITERARTVYRVCGENYFTLWAACYRLARQQLVQGWFKHENGFCQLDEQGNPIPRWSLHLIPTSSGDAVPVESEEEYLKHKQHCGFDSERWVEMKRQRAREIAKQYRNATKVDG